MSGILFLTILSVRSSYIRSIEEPLETASDMPDTLQWWVAPTGSWRIRTYALDHDIHTHAFGATGGGFLDLAKANTRKHYGDVIKSQYEIALADCSDRADVNAAFRAVDLEPRLEVSSGRFAFWKPDDARYHTRSEPKE